MNILGKKNSSSWTSDMKAKKENHINITINGKDYNDLVRRYKDLVREIKNLNHKVEELTNQMSKMTNGK